MSKSEDDKEKKKSKSKKAWRRRQDYLDAKRGFYLEVSRKLAARSAHKDADENQLAVAMDQNQTNIDAVEEKIKEHRDNFGKTGYSTKITNDDVTGMKEAVQALSVFSGRATAAMKIMENAAALLRAT